MVGKKGQAWSLDLVIASVIFLSGIIALYVYAINYTSQTKDQLDELFYQGELASKLILSETGFGIVLDGKINQSKLDEFDGYDYATKKSLLGLTDNFYFTLPGIMINGTSASYVGKINDTEIESLVQVTRLTVYNNHPVKFQIFMWR